MTRARRALQGIAEGAALFNRLEGVWYDPRSRGFYFCSTSGGDAAYGQVWHYNPAREKLTLFFESPGGSVLDSPDNRLVGINRRGEAFEFAVNVFNGSEPAGACFSPDGRALFVNLLGDGTPGRGMTCAITGPWHRGAL